MTHINSKKQRREDRPFGPQWFSIGTVCEINLPGYGSNQGTKIVTVHGMVKNGPDSYVILTGAKVEGMNDVDEGFNISHVTRIIKRAPGVAKLKERESDLWAHIKEVQWTYDSLYQEHGVTKHPSEYRTHDLEMLVRAVANDYLRDDQLLDSQSLCRAIRHTNAVRVVHVAVGRISVVVNYVNKKRFRRMVRSMLGQHLLNHFKEQRDHDAAYMADMERMDELFQD